MLRLFACSKVVWRLCLDGSQLVLLCAGDSVGYLGSLLTLGSWAVVWVAYIVCSCSKVVLRFCCVRVVVGWYC